MVQVVFQVHRVLVLLEVFQAPGVLQELYTLGVLRDTPLQMLFLLTPATMLVRGRVISPLQAELREMVVMLVMVVQEKLVEAQVVQVQSRLSVLEVHLPARLSAV
jgi:hypothetical protein